MNKRAFNSLMERVQATLSGNSIEDKEKLLAEVNGIIESGEPTKWWVILLKVIAYAIGLILAGVGTSAACTMLLPSIF